jgi:hypothetical protein
MHIYAFGSLCRGEVGADSDVDLLAIVGNYDANLDRNLFSIYSYKRLRELWTEGNPFAWHLSLEARLIFAFDKSDYIRELGSPSSYDQCVDDCHRFFALFKEARASLEATDRCTVFDLSTVFLAIRNFASCFSLGVLMAPDFSRSSALRLAKDAVPLDERAYQVFEKARILSTRGHGAGVSSEDANVAIQSLCTVHEWMTRLIKKAERNEQLQQSNSGPKSTTSNRERR